MVDLTAVTRAQAANRLLASGIENATLAETSNGTQVHIIGFSPSPEAESELERKLNEHFSDGTVHEQRGYRRLLWKQAPTPTESQWTYDQVIEGYAEGLRIYQLDEDNVSMIIAPFHPPEKSR